jgi:ankyrin repeat protein
MCSPFSSPQVIWGTQYQNHNKAPGPVYSGEGYTAMAQAIQRGPDAVKALLAQGADPNEVMTGGASPLHTCGMSRAGQASTGVLIAAGGKIEALDTYGYTPLHRMASNNLDKGARALLEAGADVNRASGPPYAGETPLDIALSSGAREVAAVLREYGGKTRRGR